MNIWAKMITALRGGVNELGESLIDNQALRILDQEVREASEELTLAKQELASLLAKKKLAEFRCEEIEQQITENEGYALQALEKKADQLALEVATKIAALENVLNDEREFLAGFEKNLNDLRDAVKNAEQNIKRLKQQVDTIKATENVQRAQVAMTQRYQKGGQSKIRTAMDSLEKIKQRQLEQEAQLQAATELEHEENSDPLMEKLTQAGIVSPNKDAQDVLERLKNSQKK